MRVSANPVLFALFDKWRGNVSSLEFDGTRFVFAGRNLPLASLESMQNCPVVRPGWLGNELSIPFSRSGAPLRIRGKDSGALAALGDSIEKAWRNHNVERYKARSADINTVLGTVRDLARPQYYPAACRMQPTLDIAGRLEQEVFSKLNKEAIGSTRFGEIETIRHFLSAPETQRQAAIERYVASQLELWSDFFDSFESNPLTPEQRLSIIVDEDATLVLAGAGSGKTSVITAKAGYLIKAGHRKPHEVLLLAFARDAAAEMSERIKDRCGEPVEARTFHALAYDIIGQVEGGKPALAAHATDDKAFLALIRDILVELALKVSEASKAILGWFTSARLEAKSEWDFQRKHDFYTYLEKEDLRTLQGEKVKSYEELLIANWLYENGVEYEYEPDYEVGTSSPTRRNYCPDFRLTESGVYLEHFGVRKQSGQGGQEVLVTAPWVDRDEYLEGMAWKRQVHQENGTILLETYSYENSEGRLLDALAEKIAPFVTLKPRPREELFDRVMQMNQVDGFVQLLGNFLRNFKSGGYAYEDCERKAQSAKLGKRAAAFLSVFRPVYEAYQDRLGTRIDFEDMVLRAANYVETGQYKSPFRHILVDEFQDISRSRARLVKGLLGQHSDARLFAVGDDWQSIYRFAGSDIHLMRNFGKEFGGTFNGKSGVHRTVDLGRTFRSVDKIAFAARHFVLQNPTQLEKIVIPAGTTDEPAIRLVSTFRHDGEEKLRGVLSELQMRAEDDGRQGTVLMLGRYRHSMPEQMRDLRRSFPNLDITFKTIHASKGLEADHVVLLDMFSGRMGFPSEIVDDPLLTMVSPEGEPFPHAEERRVMYVAMTRARKTLTLIGAASRQSTFITELLDDEAYGLGADKTEDHPTCTCGDCEGHMFAVPRKDGGTFYRCEHVELCGNTLPSCPDCGLGIPVRSEDGRSSDCRCGATFQACPVCADGWLVERSGRYGRFLGCVKFPRCNGKGRL